ncbi:MAG: class I SAM-dependent RNA methyltransferase [Planctomycetota bacterium]|jgi:23S rRNA (uracil-5-)-methyltransferase RumA
MKKTPVREGETMVLTPTRIGRRGEAEAEHAGWRVRIPHAIPGEKARVRITHVSQGGPVAVARYEGPAAAPHPARRDPPCPIHLECGGCGLQHLQEATSLALKVAQARERLAGGRWQPALASPCAFGYRAKTFLLPQRSAAALVLGARPPRGEKLVDTSGCAVLRPELEALAARARASLAERPELASHLRTVMLRCNRRGETQITLVHRGEAGDLAAVARGVGADAAFLQRHDVPGNLVCSDEEEVQVVGQGPIVETFGGAVSVRVPPTAFSQGNPDVADELYGQAAAELEGPRIGELYCGAGAAGLLALAHHPGATLHGVDRSPRAIAAARANARSNGLAKRSRFEVAAAEEVAPDWDVVHVNPPRAGCDARVLDAINGGPARKLVYLSCHPATLARDADRLGWPLATVRPADMFPQTPHLELLAVFTRS